MLTSIIELSLNNRLLVLSMVALMAIMGAYAALTIPIDAVPDMTNIQVQVVTEAAGLSPVEVERYVTYPVESAMGGIPQLVETRSVTKFGLSVVTLVFEEHMDILRARQLVQERLPDARSRMAAGYGSPELGVLATALGEVLQFEVRGTGYTPMELRTILEWDIAPQLRQVAEVNEINSHGGFYKSYEVEVDPNRLSAERVTIEEVMTALERNNASAGGGYIVHEGEQRFIRGQALLTSTADIDRVVVRSAPGDAPILVRDIATVAIAPLTRQGAATRDGRGEIVTGMVMMVRGGNSRVVVERVKDRLDHIRQTLPPGVEVEILYDRADLISRTLDTVLANLLEGGILVVVILLVTLGSARAGFIVALAIPLSMLFATNLMAIVGISASLMSLGAIDFGLIVDSSVIMIENCIRRIAHHSPGRSHMEVVRDAAIEVRKPTLFGELIIAVVYLPILTLQGTEGKLFRPMALTVLFALAGSLVLSMTLMPVLAYMGLPKRMQEHDVWLLRAVKWVYRPLVERVVKHPVMTTAVAVGVVLISIPVAYFGLGAEFMPRLDEGDILIEANRLPSATLEDSINISTQIENILNEFDEVRTVFCKTGRPEIANDVMGVQQTDVWVMLHPVGKWPAKKSRETLIGQMSERLNREVPGTAFGFTQPIEMRVDELVAGVKADVAVLLYGDDLRLLAQFSKDIERQLKEIPGAVDVKADYQANAPTLTIRVRPEQLSRYGIDAQAVMDLVGAAGGREVGFVYEGRARFPVMVRLPAAWRKSVDRLKQLMITSPQGTQVPLSEVADILLEESPPGIDHEAVRRRTFVQCNVRGRDVASFVNEAQRVIRKEVPLPSGYVIEWGGDFENLRSASLRLLIITPVVLILIKLLLYTSLKSLRLSSLIFLAVPMAASGGIFALLLRGMPFSISAGVGFVALFGVAVLNGLVWVSGAEQLREAGIDPHKAAAETALIRIRPVLMTALVASLGFLPMALSTTAGAEIQRPLASVVIGGLITSTLLTALVIPAIYPWFAPKPELPE